MDVLFTKTDGSSVRSDSITVPKDSEDADVYEKEEERRREQEEKVGGKRE